MNGQLSLLNQPRARRSDPDTSRAAAKAVGHVSGYLETQIVDVVRRRTMPCTAERIAQQLEIQEPGRWKEGSIVTAVSRASSRGLIVPCGEGKTSRGHAARLYRAAP